MKRYVPGALAGLVAAIGLAAPPALAGPTVTVRVEGEAATLLERTPVTLPDTGSAICGASKRWTVADAIDAATGGRWDRQVFVSTILGESHTFADSDYWALWNGSAGQYRFSTEGICDRVMAEGEEALMLVDRSPAPTFEPTRFPLSIRGLPAAVQAGTPVPVSVVSHGLDGSASPETGVTVAGGGASAVSGPGGTASLVFPQPGVFTVKATTPGRVASAAEPVTVSATAPAPGTSPSGAPGVPAAGTDGVGPTARLSGLRRGRVFSRRSAPRELAGSATAGASGLRSVRLAITRRRGERCWAFDGDAERFERHRCGGSSSFRIGDSADWSYLLPRPLPRGRYRIRVVAIGRDGDHGRAATRIRVR